ncbi:MAG: FHA domain-containing protein [Polyangiaceae bacterium]
MVVSRSLRRDDRGACSCWCFGGEETAIFDLPRTGEVTLGRAEDSDVRIDNPSVSRKHAVLRVGEKLSIEDLGAANGTCVRDVRAGRDPSQTQGVRRLVRESAELSIGDCILLGTVCAVVRHVPEAPAHFPDPEETENDDPGRRGAARSGDEGALRRGLQRGAGDH